MKIKWNCVYCGKYHQEYIPDKLISASRKCLKCKGINYINREVQDDKRNNS